MSDKALSLEVDESKCRYVTRETIEVCVDKENDKWSLGVFLKENEKNGLFDVQVLNQDEIQTVDEKTIRKFKGCNEKQMYVNMVTLCMGAGIFSLPWSLAGASVIPGLILIFLCMLYVFNNCKQILDSADRYNYDNMGKILEKELENYPVLSKMFFVLATATCWVSTILCIMGYYIIIYDNGKHVFQDFNANYWFIIGPCCASALTLLPNHMLSWTSFISLIVTILVIIALFISIGNNGVYKLGEGIHIFSIGRGYFCIISNMMMAMSIQYNIPSLYKEVQIRDVKKTTKVMALSFATAYAIFAITVILAYSRFGPKVKGDFLENLENLWYGTIVKVAAMLVCLFVAPLCILPITDDIEVWLNMYFMKYLRGNTNESNVGDKTTTGAEKDFERAVTDTTNDEENNKSIAFDVLMRVIKMFAIVFPVWLAYVFKIVLKQDLEKVNLYNGILVLFCYCTVTPLIVAEKLGPLDYTLCGTSFVICGLAAYFTDNHTADLDYITPNF